MASPLEERLFNALVAARPDGRVLWCSEPGSSRYHTTTNTVAPIDQRAVLDGAFECEVHGNPEIDDVNNSIEIYRDVPVLSYKADMILVLDKWRRLIVECDGHEFHDRTKQQAAYDRARDRELLRLWFVTIRFTGSEIHHSVERCAQEVYACLASLHDVSAYGELAWRCGHDHGEASAHGATSDSTYGREA